MTEFTRPATPSIDRLVDVLGQVEGRAYIDTNVWTGSLIIDGQFDEPQLEAALTRWLDGIRAAPSSQAAAEHASYTSEGPRNPYRAVEGSE